jgi:hypothetical protein
VLGWRDADGFADGAPADIVIGQTDFVTSDLRSGCASPSATTLCSPQAMAVDGSGNLYVSDSFNNRVLEFDPPFQSGLISGQSAHLVFGQGGAFSNNQCDAGTDTPSADTLCIPWGIAVDAADVRIEGSAARGARPDRGGTQFVCGLFR